MYVGRLVYFTLCLINTLATTPPTVTVLIRHTVL